MSKLDWLVLLRKFSTVERLEMFIRLKEYSLDDTQAELLRTAAEERLDELVYIL